MPRRPLRRWRGETIVALAALLAGLGGACAPGSAHAVQGTGPYAAEAAKMVPKVERAVGLRFKHPPTIQARSRDEVRTFLERQFGDPRAARDLAGTEIAYKLFDLIPDTLDLRAELERLLTEQIVGFYDPETKVLYVVDSAPEAQVSTVVAHELVHALQDQYINLDSIQKLEGENDRQSAAEAVIEGQAVYDQLVVATGNPDFLSLIPGGWDAVREEIRENQASMPAFANAPMVLQESLIFPYLSGAEFMRRFAAQEPGQQPYGARMPTLTKQVLHSETAYFEHRDPPLGITLPAPANPAVTVRYANTLGEFETRLFLYQHLGDQNAAVRGAAAWEGDRYEVLDVPPRDRALVWVTIWDSAVDAGQFRELALQVAAGLNAAHPKRTVSLTPVEIQGRPAIVYIDAPTGMSRSALIGMSRSALLAPGRVTATPVP